MTPRPPGPRDAGACREGFAFLEHTADIRLLAWAPGYPGMVAQALLGLASLITPPADVVRAHTRVIDIEASDPVSAVVQALNELLFLFDTEGFLLGGAAVECGGATGCGQSPALQSPLRVTLRLEGDLLGFPAREYSAAAGAKAATYGDAEVAYMPGQDRWQGIITLDI